MGSIAHNFALTHMHFCSACIVLMRTHTVFNHSMLAKSWCPCPINASKSLFKRDQRPIIWPPPAYFKLVCTPLRGLWRELSGERPLYLIHEAGSSSIPLLFNLSGDTIFSRVKKPPSPLPRLLLSHRITCSTHPPAEVSSGIQWEDESTSQENNKNFQGPEKNEQLVLGKESGQRKTLQMYTPPFSVKICNLF